MIEIPARHRFETMSASRPDAASRDEEAPHPLRPVDVDASLDLLGTLLDRPAIQDAPVDNRALWRWLRRWFHLESTWRQGIETSLTELPTSAFRFNRAAELLHPTRGGDRVGAIVGTWLKRDGRLDAPVDVERVRAVAACFGQ